ncbi:hypothetical protein [Streptomyces curacoi]|uniref:hypothetical protein n=1 Tax=Streptomyces curacoi TaxID=146536 RepID=UPI00131B9FAC|nr:hypothetical protein [Streptomyces curacoi]
MTANEEDPVYVVVQHKFLKPEAAFPRGQALIDGTGAPEGTRVLQFYPHVEGSAATCLWETESVEDVQRFVDTTLGDSSINVCYEVDAEMAFAESPRGLKQSSASAS